MTDMTKYTPPIYDEHYAATKKHEAQRNECPAQQRVVSKTVETYCFGCSKNRPCKAIGTYKYEGEAYNIYICQWCRAEITKRKKRGLRC